MFTLSTLVLPNLWNPSMSSKNFQISKQNENDLKLKNDLEFLLSISRSALQCLPQRKPVQNASKVNPKRLQNCLDTRLAPSVLSQTFFHGEAKMGIYKLGVCSLGQFSGNRFWIRLNFFPVSRVWGSRVWELQSGGLQFLGHRFGIS